MKVRSQIKLIVLLYLIACLMQACANRGQGPQGGPKDITPPVVKKETPLNGSLNYRSKEIEVEFDELILVENTMDNVVISPPQTKLPDIKARGKKLSVVFAEDLQDSTTYTINFGNAVVDNNEKNPLKGYSFSFSTGSIIDSLQIGGVLLNAEDLNPVLGVLAGIHSNLHDTAFTTQPFERIAKTDSAGYFCIQNIKHGTYRLYALGDVSRDYCFQQGEMLAWHDSLITPTVSSSLRSDTLWADSVTIDTVKQVTDYVYGPDSLVFFYFKEARQRQYFMKVERPQPHFFRLYFGAPAETQPRLDTVDYNWLSAMLMQNNLTNDTITCWLTDSLVINMDTLRFAMTYMKTDSLFQLQPQTDTLAAIYRRPKVGRIRKDEIPRQTFVSLKSNATGAFEIYNDIQLTSATPLAMYTDTMVHLFQRVDTVLVPLPFTMRAVDSTRMSFVIEQEWIPETSYELQVDSAAMRDIYNNVNNVYTGKFKVRSLEEYSNLFVKIQPFDSLAVIQLLSPRDEVVRQVVVNEDGAAFANVKPGDYYLRLFIDSNADGKWTTGDYSQKRQPEQVIYNPKKMSLRANWDFEELWNIFEFPVLEQKPEELIKVTTGVKKGK